MLTLAIIIGVPGLLIWFWNQIVYFFAHHAIPWVRSHMGDNTADAIAFVISFADNAITATRREIQTGWRFLKNHVRGVGTLYEDLKNQAYRATTKILVLADDGKNAKEVTVQRNIGKADLPFEVLRKMIANNQNSVTTNDLEIVEHQFKEAAAKQGLILEDNV